MHLTELWKIIHRTVGYNGRMDTGQTRSILNYIEPNMEYMGQIGKQIGQGAAESKMPAYLTKYSILDENSFP